jgi:hypothetical protein
MNNKLFHEIVSGFANAKKKATVNILGVEIPLEGIQYATSTVRSAATLGEWNNYFNESIFFDESPFFQLTSRDRPLPLDAGVNRQFFTYAPPTERTPDYDEQSKHSTD